MERFYGGGIKGVLAGIALALVGRKSGAEAYDAIHRLAHPIHGAIDFVKNFGRFSSGRAAPFGFFTA